MEKPPALFSESAIEDEARTADGNSDHIVGNSLEADSAMYKTVLVGDKGETMKYLNRGSRLSVSVNMENFSIYIGKDHLTMQEQGSINSNNLCAAYVRFDKGQNKVTIEDFTDWRKGSANAFGVKSTIAEAIQRDLF